MSTYFQTGVFSELFIDCTREEITVCGVLLHCSWLQAGMTCSSARWPLWALTVQAMTQLHQWPWPGLRNSALHSLLYQHSHLWTVWPCQLTWLERLWSLGGNGCWRNDHTATSRHTWKENPQPQDKPRAWNAMEGYRRSFISSHTTPASPIQISLNTCK